MAVSSAALLALVKNAKNKYSRGGNSVKLKEGKTTIRLLVAPDNTSGKFWQECGVHWIKTEKDGKPVAVVGCRDEVYGQPCEICTAIDKAAKAVTSDEELAIIKEWKTKKTALVCALVKSGSDKSPEPQVVELTGGAFADVLSTWETYLADDVNILDPETGVDLVIERSGRGFDTKYRVQVAPRSEPVDKDILTRLPDLMAHIEKEFFRGDESKALLAISNMSGINVDALTKLASSHRPAGLLTSSVVPDAEVAEIAEIIADEIAEVEVVEEVTETDDEREERELTEKMAALAAKKKAAAAAAAKTPDPAAVKAAAVAKAKAAAAAKAKADAAAKAAAEASTVSKDDGFGEAVPQDEIDDLLKDLDA